jgi:hypothetical protein
MEQGREKVYNSFHMREKAALTVLILVLSQAACRGDGNDLYSIWTDAFSSFADPNTGLTVFPTLQIPMGGRYEGMGTAYTAMALDAGFIESNPAASALLPNSQLAFSHHSWIADSNLEAAVYTTRFEDLGIGFGGKFLFVPFTEYNDWGEKGAKGYISETIVTANVSYNFLRSYYFSGLSLGGNLKVAYRNIPAVFASNQSAFAVMTDLGASTSFNFLKPYVSRNRNFSVGAVLKNLGLSSQPGEQLPLTATAGLAYSPLGPWTLTCDFNYPISLDPVNAPAERWYLGFGSNVNVASFLSIQSGVLMKADNPRISLGTTLNLDVVTFVVNYNLDLSGQISPLDKFSIQAEIGLGDQGRAARQEQAEKLYLSGVEQYAEGHYDKAIEFWKRVLELDKTYTPAREDIETTQRNLDLQREMESRGTL